MHFLQCTDGSSRQLRRDEIDIKTTGHSIPRRRSYSDGSWTQTTILQNTRHCVLGVNKYRDFFYLFISECLELEMLRMTTSTSAVYRIARDYNT